MLLRRLHVFRTMMRAVLQTVLIREPRRGVELLVVAASVTLIVLYSTRDNDTPVRCSQMSSINVADKVPARLEGATSSAALTRQGFWLRREAMLKHCSRSADNGSWRNLSRQDLSYLMYNDEHRIVFCGIPKVSVTNWRKTFLALARRGSVSIPDKINHAEAHLNSPNLTMCSQEGVETRLRDYGKVIFVRDPLDRLLSAYRDKFASGPSQFIDWYGKQIIRQRKRKESNGRMKDSHISFEDFIRFITGPGFDLNEHWRRFERICRPCIVKYDFIGSYESFDNDRAYIFDHFGLTKNVEFPTRKGYDAVRTKSIAKEAYSNLPMSLLKALWQLYEKEYSMFNLPKPPYIEKLVSQKANVPIK